MLRADHASHYSKVKAIFLIDLFCVSPEVQHVFCQHNSGRNPGYEDWSQPLVRSFGLVGFGGTANGEA